MAWSDHLRRGIFVLLLTPVVSVLTAFAVSAAGVADDQGMAGPATVLVWAAMAALIAFVGGFFLARQIPSARLVQLNLLLAILAGILAVYVGFRLSRQASSTPPADPRTGIRIQNATDFHCQTIIQQHTFCVETIIITFLRSQLAVVIPLTVKNPGMFDPPLPCAIRFH